MYIRNYKLSLLVMIMFLPVFSQSWKDDSLAVRQILDTNGLENVKVDEVVIQKDSAGRAKWVVIAKLQSFDFLPASIKKLDHLTTLNISNTNLTKIPPEIGDLKSITVLGLYYNKITSLPSEIGNLEEIRTMSVDHNELTALPPEIGSLKKLYFFQFQHNKISSIPDEICDMDSLETIWADNNLISYIPEDIGYMPAFHYIDLDYNNLKHVPNSLIPYGLDNVDMCYNDSLVFTEEQKAAWGVKDYEDYFNKVCEAEVKEEVVQKQPENSPIHINPHAILLRVNHSSHITCSVYNLCGRRIETLVNGTLSAGTYSVSWNRANYGPGIYFVRYSAINGHSSVKKVIVK